MNMLPLIDIQLDRGSATNQIPVWNDTSKRFVPSTTLTGITLGTPWTLAGDGSWTGDSVLNMSSGTKELSIINNSVTAFAIKVLLDSYLNFDTSTPSIDFGNAVTNQAFNFLGTGPANFGGNILVNGGFIGDTSLPGLIEIDGSEPDVTVHGDLIVDDDLTVSDVLIVDSVNKAVAINTTATALIALRVAGLTGDVGLQGQRLELICGIGGTGAAGATSGAGGGGAVTLRSGVGGGASLGTSANNAGNGGDVGFVSGNGGLASGASGDNTGGIGGEYTLLGGTGGNALGATAGDNLGGDGGGFAIQAGAGGLAASGASNIGGDGGDIAIDAGVGGLGIITANGAAGNIYLGGTTGNVRIGDTTTPTEKLEVVGNTVMEGDLIVDDTLLAGIKSGFGAVNAGALLNIEGSLSSTDSAFIRALRFLPELTSSVSDFVGILVQPTFTGAFTQAISHDIRITPPVLAGGATVTRHISLDIKRSIIATNQAAIMITNDSSVFTGRWGIYDNMPENWTLHRDSKKIYFGAAEDSYIEFDGNSMNITANAVTGTDSLLLTAGHTNINSNVRIGDTTTPVYALEVAGVVKSESGRIVETTRLTSGTTLTTAHHHVFCDTGGAFTVSLPASPIDGQTYRIINSGSNTLTIDPNGKNIAGSSLDITLNAGDILIITYETTENWW